MPARPSLPRRASATRSCSKPISPASPTSPTQAASSSASRGPDELVAAYADLAGRLGPAALVCETVARGTELALGVVRDPDLGPLIVIGAGGILVELIADRVVTMPPVAQDEAAGLLAELKVAALLAGARGAPPADLGAIARAIAGLAELASELGEDIDALDINPLICGPDGAIAVDALVIPR